MIGAAGKVPLKELLVVAHRLDRMNTLVTNETHHAINQQQGIAMRQRFQDAPDIEAALAIAHCLVPAQRPVGLAEVGFWVVGCAACWLAWRCAAAISRF